MQTSPTLIDWILNLIRDHDAREAFQADPRGYTADHGFGAASAADMHDALCVAADTGSAHSDYQSGSNSSDRDSGRDHHSGGHDRSDHLPSPRQHHHGEDAPHYLNHYINNYTTVEQHNTNIDDSVHQDVDTHGGDFAQHIDNDPVVASGDHSVAAGHGINGSTLTSGSGNVVGEDNQAQTGDGNSTAFGTGNASSTEMDHANFGNGSALSVNGTADGQQTDNDTTTSVHNSGSGDTGVNAAGANGYADHQLDQHQSDTSTHSDYDDSSRSDSHDALNSHNDSHLADSHDYDVHHV